eukprot:1151594-Prymnesium_polylepis.1
MGARPCDGEKCASRVHVAHLAPLAHGAHGGRGVEAVHEAAAVLHHEHEGRGDEARLERRLDRPPEAVVLGQLQHLRVAPLRAARRARREVAQRVAAGGVERHLLL